jgi:hypothetical protein
MVKSEKIYSPQQYLEAVTGLCYAIGGEDDIGFIQRALYRQNLELWDYPLSEIGYIVENDLNVVLVDCMVVNEETDQFEHQYRWFEVPEDFKEEAE